MIFLPSNIFDLQSCVVAFCKTRFEFETRTISHKTYHRDEIFVYSVFQPHARAVFYFGFKLDFERFEHMRIEKVFAQNVLHAVEVFCIVHMPVDVNLAVCYFETFRLFLFAQRYAESCLLYTSPSPRDRG